MNQQPPRRAFLPWEDLRTRLDEGPHFNTMRGTPYYRDAVYEQFSNCLLYTSPSPRDRG